MSILSENALWESFGLRALGYAGYGGSDLGECFTTVRRIGNGTPEDWYREWMKTADRVFGIAESCEANGHVVSAREAFFRASTYYHVAYFPLFGAPVNPWLVEAFERETAAFQRAARLNDFPVEPVEVPFENTTLPGHFLRPAGEARKRPTVLHVNPGDVFCAWPGGRSTRI